MALVQSVIEQIVSRGCAKNFHIQWDKAIVYSLRMIRSKRAVKRKPGYQHFELEYYKSIHGNWSHNNKGLPPHNHRRHVLEGVDGVLIPDAPITNIEVEEVQDAQQSGEVDDGLNNT